MLTLHGFSSSNHHNIIKLSLLEKGVQFEESVVYNGVGDNLRPDLLRQSPNGNVPYLETDGGFIFEARHILEYLERAFPTNPLYPKGAVEAAEIEDLIRLIDLYLKLAARRLLPNYFARRPTSEHVTQEIRAALDMGAKAIGKLARFDTFILGDTFSAADIAATIHFPVVQGVVDKVLGCDPLAEVPGLSAYLARMEQRPSVQRIRLDQEADRPLFLAHLQAQQNKT